MGDIFREIDEELRQERFEKLWQRYGKIVIGAAVAVVLAVAGFKAFEHFQTKQRDTYSAQYAAASKLLAEGKKTEAAALFAGLGKDGNTGYAVLSRFQQAAIRADTGDIPGAIKLYDAIASDNDVDKSLQEAAVIFSVSRQIDSGSADRTALDSKLTPLRDKENPWRHSANELSGLLALQAGDSAVARSRFTSISDDLKAPQRMRTRASQILAVIAN
ncbi:MAG: tetratricopeptide repeat protein [Alphaproteobacteria bacterium]|nr:tetratricopeptide repeat protein [Alphaproteobacteria bacterium]